jgi:hypothetical protein
MTATGGGYSNLFFLVLRAHLPGVRLIQKKRMQKKIAGSGCQFFFFQENWTAFLENWTGLVERRYCFPGRKQNPFF